MDVGSTSQGSREGGDLEAPVPERNTSAKNSFEPCTALAAKAAT